MNNYQPHQNSTLITP